MEEVSGFWDEMLGREVRVAVVYGLLIQTHARVPHISHYQIALLLNLGICVCFQAKREIQGFYFIEHDGGGGSK